MSVRWRRSRIQRRASTSTPGWRSVCTVSPRGRAKLVPWTSLHEQFGHGYRRIPQVPRGLSARSPSCTGNTRSARLEAQEGGLVLRNSPPPVPARIDTRPTS